jgi:hypothetical protein
MRFLVAVVALGGAAHEHERQQAEHRRLNQADEKFQTEEDYIHYRQDKGHHEEQYLPGEDISKKTEGERQ